MHARPLGSIVEGVKAHGLCADIAYLSREVLETRRVGWSLRLLAMDP